MYKKLEGPSMRTLFFSSIFFLYNPYAVYDSQKRYPDISENCGPHAGLSKYCKKHYGCFCRKSHCYIPNYYGFYCPGYAYGFGYASNVVIHDYYIRGFNCRIRTQTAHRYSNTCACKRGGVVYSVSDKSYDLLFCVSFHNRNLFRREQL